MRIPFISPPVNRDCDVAGVMPAGPALGTRQIHLRRVGAALALCAAVVACGGGSGTAAPVAGGGTSGGSSGGTSGGTTTPSNPLPTFDTTSVAPGTTASALPDGWQNGAFMQVFVRSYQDSNGDGIGDLRGLISRLDYLRDLGVRGLWLMPIQPSQDGDHGYAVKDYRAVEPQYGTLADLDELVAQAHARGIGVILDYVVNHSAAQHPAFVNSRAARDNPYRSWYVWQDTAPSGWSVFGRNPWSFDFTGWYYSPFWDQMPDFNLRNPAVQTWHHDNLRFWMNRGVDGFRFDAVGLLVENGPGAWLNQPESRTFMSQVRTMLNAYSRRFMVCEGADDPQGFAQACGSAFAFDINGAIVKAAKGSNADLVAVSRYFSNALPATSTLLANHDLFAGDRVWNQLAGDVAAYKLAAATYLLMPGTPFIYYGEEIGLAAAANITDDGRLRTPMSWTADTTKAGFTTGSPYRALSANVATNNVQAQAAQADSILNFYKAMLALRNSRLSIARGSYDRPFVQGTTLGFIRTLGQERTLVLINTSSQAVQVNVTELPTSAVLTTLYPAGVQVTSASFGAAQLDVPARSVRILDIK